VVWRHPSDACLLCRRCPAANLALDPRVRVALCVATWTTATGLWRARNGRGGWSWPITSSEVRLFQWTWSCSGGPS
jgi:hypothetical protein